MLLVMYVKRELENKVRTLLDHFPAIAVLGPRQVGKTTLGKKIRKELLRESIYLDLENPVDAGALDHPTEFLRAVAEKTVFIDEIQRKPDLFPVLRSVIDESPSPGRFILLGSASPQLLFLSNETIAGRIVYLELHPFQPSEICQLKDFRDHWLRGGFPSPFLQEHPDIRREWFKSFVLAYTERDLRLLGLSLASEVLTRLLQMLVTMQGGLLNSSALANSLGVTAPTVNTALSFLERSFMIRLLKPWHSNIGKRLVKSPKVYVRDSGIINYLLGLGTYQEMLRNPLVGQLWEGFVIENIINTLGADYQYFFYRTADGAECDLVIIGGGVCLATVETKFAPRITRTKSMFITQQDLKPKQAFVIVPECQASYLIGDNLFVATIEQFFRTFSQ